MNNKAPLIIVGMHRSGTSLLASWINALGINIGDRLMGKGIANVKGHFEDLDFHDLHELIFKKHKINYGALKGKLEFELNQEDKGQIRKLTNLKIDNNIQWGWKDPRTCLFLDYYSELFPEAKYLILHRNCKSVVESLTQRDIKRFDTKMQKSGVINFIKNKLRRRTYHKNIFLRSKQEYENAWLHYNQKIMDLIESIDESKYLIIDVKSILTSEDKIYTKLINWNYQFKKVPFLSLFDSKLFNSKNKSSINYKKTHSVTKMENYFKSILYNNNQI